MVKHDNDIVHLKEIVKYLGSVIPSISLRFPQISLEKEIFRQDERESFCVQFNCKICCSVHNNSNTGGVFLFLLGRSFFPCMATC